MAHCIEAILVTAATDRAPLAAAKDAHPIPLPQGLVLIPLTDAFFEGLPETASGGAEKPYEQFWKFSKRLLHLVESLSRNTAVAYIETEYFAGEGAQAAAVWKDGQLIYGPEQAAIGPINAALRYLGVRANTGLDEFDAVGLGRFRSNDDWIVQPQFGKGHGTEGE